MKTSAKPQPQPVVQVTVGQLFAQGCRYNIPDHQRPYEWTEAEVEALLRDVYTRYKRNLTGLGRYYQFNAMTWWDDDDRRVIFDGQQRVTTLYLLMAGSLKTVVEELQSNDLNASDREQLEVSRQLLLASLQIASMSGSAELRLVDQFEESNDTLRAIVDAAAKGKPVSNKSGYSKAYQTITTWIDETFSGDGAGSRGQALRGYLEYLLEYSVFSVHQVETEEDGWDAFDKANNRGRPLTEADRLKHWAWGQASEDRRKVVITEWNTMALNARKRGQDLDSVLALSMTGRYAKPTDKTISKKHIYKAVLDGGSAHSAATSDSAGFVEHLRKSGDLVLSLMSATGPDGKIVPPVAVARRLFGNVPTQMLPLLLAGTGLPTADFERYCDEILKAWVVHTNSPALPEAWTVARAAWLPVVRKMKGTADVDAFVNDYLSPFKASNTEGFAGWFRTLSLCTAEGSKPRTTDRMIRFILGICEEALREEIGRVPAQPAHFADYYLGSEPTAHLEHILPEKFDAEEAEDLFGGLDEAEKMVHCIGNLSLLTKAENKKANNHAYSQKFDDVYRHSEFDLSRALHTATTGPVGAVLSATPVWNIEKIIGRHKELYRLTCRLLGVPAVEGFIPAAPEVKTNGLGFRMIQANTPAALLSLVRKIAAGASSKVQKTALKEAGLDPDRQYSYYTVALRELGIIAKEKKEKGAGTWRLVYGDVAPSEIELAEFILKHPASLLIEEVGIDEFRQRALAEYDRSEKTTNRQVDCHGSLYSWATDIVEENDTRKTASV